MRFAAIVLICGAVVVAAGFGSRIVQSGQSFVPSASTPAMTFNLLKTLVSATDATSYTTTGYQPTANALVLAGVVCDQNLIGGTTPTATGNGLTWVKMAETNFATLGSPLKKLVIFRSQGASPTTNGFVADFAGQTQTGISISIVEFPSADDSAANGANAIVQTVYNAADASNACVVVMGAMTGTQNAMILFGGDARSPFGGTPQSNWTEDVDLGHTLPNTGIYTAHILATVSNTVNIAIAASVDWAGVAIEVKQKP